MNESRAGLVFFVALILANCSLNPGAAPPGAASPGGDIIRGPTPDVATSCNNLALVLAWSAKGGKGG